MGGPKSSTQDAKIRDALLRILEDEVGLTVGCTDPSAIGLGTAAAVNIYTKKKGLPRLEADDLTGRIQKVVIDLDMNLYKNAAAVVIPGTGRKGVRLAAALGLLVQDPEKKLRLFNGLPETALAEVDRLLELVPLKFNVREDFVSITMDVKIKWRDGHTTLIRIKGHHDSIVRLAFDDEDLPADSFSGETGKQGPMMEDLPMDSLEWICEQVVSLPEDQLGLLIEGFETNLAAAIPGIKGGKTYSDVFTYGGIYGASDIGDGGLDGRGLDQGSGLVRRVLESRAEKLEDVQALREAKISVAAATRMRMNGEDVPIMACGGSGNHGITFFLSLLPGWRLREVREDRSLLHGAMIGILLLHRIKEQTGVITPMCGCAVASGLSVAAAVVWGMGGSPEEMLQAMNIVLSSLGGIVCDGAKPSCALKTALSAQVSLEAARMAVNGLTVPGDEGLGAETFSELLKNIRRIHLEGMALFDRTMVSIIRDREIVR